MGVGLHELVKDLFLVTILAVAAVAPGGLSVETKMELAGELRLVASSASAAADRIKRCAGSIQGHTTCRLRPSRLNGGRVGR